MSNKNSENINYQYYAELLELNPNLIIQGVSGTEKSFTAHKIIESFEKLKNKELNFASIEKEGRVKSITFHNSYTYEQFIEGIGYPKNNGNYPQIPETGIFLQMAISASREILVSDLKNKIKNSISLFSKIWKVSLGYRKTEERIYHLCKKAKEIAVGWLENESLEGKSYNEIYSMLEARRGNDEPKLTSDAGSINALVNDMKKGDFVLIYDSPRTITDIGIVTGEYFHDQSAPYPHKRKVYWFKEFKSPVDIAEFDSQTRLTLKTIYELEQLNFSDLRKIIRENISTNHNQGGEAKIKPYYLVIDQINRGKTADIFGEAISLLPKEKRDSYKCNLLFSKKSFILPPNLFLIGLLNPQVKSAIDPVIHSHFLFINLSPNPNKLFNCKIKTSGKDPLEINLSRLLINLNIKLAKNIGNDYQIGHSFFLNIKNIDILYKTFYYRIIPLLANYFSNDVKQIKNIIGPDFFDAGNNLKYLEINNINVESQFIRALLSI